MATCCLYRLPEFFHEVRCQHMTIGSLPLNTFRRIFNLPRIKPVASTLADSCPLKLNQKRQLQLDSDMPKLGWSNRIVHVKFTVPTCARVETTIKNAVETIPFNFMCTRVFHHHVCICTRFARFLLRSVLTRATRGKRIRKHFGHHMPNLFGRCFLR